MLNDFQNLFFTYIVLAGYFFHILLISFMLPQISTKYIPKRLQVNKSLLMRTWHTNG